MERALLVTIQIRSEKDPWKLEDYALELEELVATCGAEVVDNITCIKDKPTPNLFIGKGKAEEIALICEEEKIDTVIFSHDISSTQQRNLDAIINKKTIDRTQLILDIFAKHALTPEGKTQVELAQLQYLLPRLTGKGVILSRLGGGIGTRGPGEQKLEVDRRRIRAKIDRLKQDLIQLSLHRKTMRKKRKENSIPLIALVGYTNAGKSTLLNTLTNAGQNVRDSLFTTLDPLSKMFRLGNGEEVILTDTVGFLHKLPHNLVEAFKATLEEVTEADLLIHVLDASHPRARELNKSVLEVLEELGALEKPMFTVLNKIDLIEDPAWLFDLKQDIEGAIPISAKLNQNVDTLITRVEDNFKGRMKQLKIMIPHKRMDLVDMFYKKGKVKEIEYLDKGIKILVELPNIMADKVLSDKTIEQIG